jgi:hypothetical protein
VYLYDIKCRSYWGPDLVFETYSLDTVDNLRNIWNLQTRFKANRFAAAKYQNPYLEFISFYCCCRRMPVVAICKQDDDSNMLNNALKYSNFYRQFIVFIEKRRKFITIQYKPYIQTVHRRFKYCVLWTTTGCSKQRINDGRCWSKDVILISDRQQKNILSLNPRDLTLLLRTSKLCLATIFASAVNEHQG